VPVVQTGKLVTSKALIINGSTGVKATPAPGAKSVARHLQSSGNPGKTGYTTSANGIVIPNTTGGEDQGRSTVPLMSGISTVSTPIYSTDVLNYTVFGQTLAVVVSTAYAADGVTPTGPVTYTGLFSDNYSGFTIQVNADGTFSGSQKLLLQLVDVNGDIFEFQYSRSTINGAFRAAGGFDATGVMQRVVNQSWLFATGCAENYSTLYGYSGTFVAKAGANGLAVLTHLLMVTNATIDGSYPLGEDQPWTLTSTDARGLALIDRVIAQTVASDVWIYDGSYLPTNGTWLNYKGTVRADVQYAALNY
jgi:hypothetical protein